MSADRVRVLLHPMPNAKLVKPANKKEEKDKQGTEDMCVQNNTQQHDMMDLLR